METPLGLQETNACIYSKGVIQLNLLHIKSIPQRKTQTKALGSAGMWGGPRADPSIP